MPLIYNYSTQNRIIKRRGRLSNIVRERNREREREREKRRESERERER